MEMKLDGKIFLLLFSWSIQGSRGLEIQLREKEKSLRVFSHLTKSKYYILNGDIERAKFYLKNVIIEDKFLPIKKRYLGIIYFIENKFQKSLDMISSNIFYGDKFYSQICVLKILNLMALGKRKEFLKERRLCMRSTFEYGRNNQMWLLFLERFNRENINIKDYEFETVEEAAIFIKHVLFVGREDLVEEIIENLPGNFYKSGMIRELLAMALYRLGRSDEAFEFVEGVESPNADNIRGNIYLKQKKHLLALGYFKLALQSKVRSKNALERSASILWVLKRWKEGLDIVNRLKEESLSLKAAYLIRLENFKEAKKNTHSCGESI